MITQDSDYMNSRLDEAGLQNKNLTQLLNFILNSYLRRSDDIFAVLDNSAKIIYCFDEDKILFDKQELGMHIVNSSSNAELIKNISDLIEDPVSVKNIDVETYKISIVPAKNEDDILIGVIVAGNFGR
jgi:hypothetical protein